ncbi:MAG: aminomethyl-transferring glycine dehydrogenase subunit GcvPB [Bacteroidetes bacterium]|nr:aminomethyl-transferring glycine dehydrogenase subunit GcvPB [Rhodothermia bacterium]MCS7155859.1 aminomethyl-transferring glycine dehydrogenase subunit GcvPB [Bacteroidota bacterium]MCX7906040.1 aminomethyl-transferring glycine dehydrogenase subunit GcvPB [Bacteroidota bacterium]MDW8138168.1 aminomethyl-transferring glycine dehydrogenase subunit GcvPB [Bacteroidota bacterium]MDW8285852.1 aminomethyl-transferring glycine dehydrogenase subunit GcvPB [Bacteroidota bacterium]
MPEPLLFEKTRPGRKGYTLPRLDVPESPLPQAWLRSRPAELPELSEPEVVRHFVRLSSLNFHIDKGFYPLGSCTMKYNPKLNERLAALPGWTGLHPLAPEPIVQGALRLMYELQELLKEITGMAAVSLQPAAGSQGELTGLLLFRRYHERQGEQRTKILVPDSAHGTNPASVRIAGYEVVNIRSNENGLTDLEALQQHLDERVAGLMVTNPNTLGLFERQIQEIAHLVHSVGGLLYMDGANLNALLGIARPGDMGFDVVHMNLHKTFSTPHGGGGPGSGPVAVAERLREFLPKPEVCWDGTRYRLNWDKPESVGKVHAFWGNFGMFVRAYAYIRLHGPEGLRRVSEHAILNANYLLRRLWPYYEAPYPGPVMHECVLSAVRQKAHGVRALDIAKRILDYGFHAPTVYFPLIVPEALMIEPTETESKETLDAFIEAMIQIAQEAETQPERVRTAPHTTPVRRLDDAYAARHVNVRFEEPSEAMTSP